MTRDDARQRRRKLLHRLAGNATGMTDDPATPASFAPPVGPPRPLPAPFTEAWPILDADHAATGDAERVPSPHPGPGRWCRVECSSCGGTFSGQERRFGSGGYYVNNHRLADGTLCPGTAATDHREATA